MNVFTIEGRLTKDADQRFTQQGTAVAGFTVASDVGFGNNKKTLFMSCSLWGKRAEGGLVQHLTKGTQVMCIGELQPHEWTDRDGNQRKDVKLNLSDIKLLVSSGHNAGSSGHSEPSSGHNNNTQSDPFGDSQRYTDDHYVDDAIPF